MIPRVRDNPLVINQKASTDDPILLFLHGGSGSGPLFRAQTHLNELSGSVALFPTALVNQLGFTGWNCGGPFNREADDCDYLCDLIDKVAANYSLKPSNSYIIGHSNGAMLGYRLICQRPDKWKGLYSMAGNLHPEINNPGTYRGKIREVHGTADQNVPILGGHGKDSFYKVNWNSVYDVIGGFTKIDTPGVGNINALPGFGHSMPQIIGGLEAQGTTLHEDIKQFIER